MLNSNAVVAEIDSILQKYAEYRSEAKYEDLSDLKGGIKSEMLALLGAAIERVSPPNSVYRKQAEGAYAEYGRDSGHNITVLTGVLKALRADYVAGRLQSLTELIHADLFADFLEMAEHLHTEGYKDAAAIIAGSVLEGHLRKLCEKNSIVTETNGKPKKADALNSELAIVGIYSKLDQKNVTAWLGLRNHAAHGQYTEYTKDQVTFFLQAIRDFIARCSA